ncbi:uncharacterized protein MYCFIDRAFT_211012 [Pseudocercospora fijiensis CIRAD86]|uniref:Mitochondrial carrier protein n=1 Tax=Pseudocercospora fijiensis (strain CIRAD86) TaxID=383855 RepID=M3B6F9_PSEFD|nr:uncharacterized protein MYCFIDRAFT_211012 [Pseudocercospora fijiensis CIRAD86]EME84923.1 hypothetical protein MYCFIDRAFT_211012 [Pseudocercospora fijiensis CIRAD86]
MKDKIENFFAYNSQLDAFTLYHLIQEEQYGAGDSSIIAPALPALGHALAGGLASALSKAVVYPIDTIVTRLQVQKQLKGDKEAPSAASEADVEYKNPIDAAQKIYKNEGGLQAFYQGLNSDVVKHIADSFFFFLAYNSLRDGMLRRQGGKQLPVVKELSVGVLAGAISKAITQPISQVVVRQQTAALVAARDPESSSSRSVAVKDIVKQIREEKGIAGFWAGYSAQLILTLNPAITFAVNNLLKSLVPKKQRENPTPQLTFLLAALSKVIATSITYPVMLAKSRAQVQRGSTTETDPSEHNYVSVDGGDRKTQARQYAKKALKLVEAQTAIYYALRKIYQQEGVAGLYSGLDGEVAKGFLQHGLTMTAKDGVHAGVIQLYYILLKATKRWDAELAKATEAAKERAKNVAATTVEVAKNALGQ